jgi:pimeloyl-ACP methyl ester carboxylesterase
VNIAHRFVDTNGIRMHLAEAGSGPLVVLLHGFPESWYSWRHQLTALADAGFHVVAPDQRSTKSRPSSSDMTGAPRSPGIPHCSVQTGSAALEV